MAKIRIFIISRHLMFGRGLESLLRQESSFDIIGQEREISEAIKQIEMLQPDVVILDDDETVSDVMSILKTNPTLQVISLNLQNNDLYAYRVRQGVNNSVEDLLKVIREKNE